MNYDKYVDVFSETFGVEKEDAPHMQYGKSEGWDSAAHMILISALEETFDIMFDTEDIIGLNSFEKGLEVLKEKYDVEF